MQKLVQRNVQGDMLKTNIKGNLKEIQKIMIKKQGDINESHQSPSRRSLHQNKG